MNEIAFGIELLVAALLAATVSWCVILDRRLRRLRADEQGMRRVVSELAQATERAERAIGALKQTVTQADASLSERLLSAERFAADLSVNVRAGEDIIDRVRQIVENSRRAAPAPAAFAHVEPVPAPQPAVDQPRPVGARLAAAAMAAERVIERARQRREAA